MLARLTLFPTITYSLLNFKSIDGEQSDEEDDSNDSILAIDDVSSDVYRDYEESKCDIASTSVTK